MHSPRVLESTSAAPPISSMRSLRSVFNEILRAPHAVEKLAKQGLTTGGGTPEHFRDFIANDIVKWQKVVQEAGLVAEASR